MSDKKELEIIHEFCNTRNPRILSHLSENNKKIFIGIARYVMNYLISHPNSRPDIALIALRSLDPFNYSCLSHLKVTLTDVQRHTIEYFSYVKSLLVCLSTGGGKTIVAYGISQCYLNKYPNNKVVVISPVTLLKNFHKESEKFGGVIDDRYSFYSFEKFLRLDKDRKRVNCKNTLLIIDEAHILRNFTGKKYDSVMMCANKADKILLLTATPIVNSISDYVSIINLLYQNYIISTGRTRHVLNIINKGAGNTLSNILKIDTPYKIKISQSRDADIRYKVQLQQLPKIGKLLAGHVIYKSKVADENFPSYNTHVEFVDMSLTYLDAYIKSTTKSEENALFSNPKVFWNGYRRAVNHLGIEYYSSKVRAIAPKIKGKQSIIYSNWLEYGTDILGRILMDNCISYGVISGTTNVAKRSSIINKFNNEQISTLIITKAGTEGIDLKGVRNVVLLDPAWSPAVIDQVIGRAVRFKSHDHLPPDQRHVDIYLMQLKEPHINSDNLELSKSGDVILYRIIKKKSGLTNESNNMLKDLSVI